MVALSGKYTCSRMTAACLDPGGGGGGIYIGVGLPWHTNKGGLRCGHSPQKGGGLKCGHNQKRAS